MLISDLGAVALQVSEIVNSDCYYSSIRLFERRSLLHCALVIHGKAVGEQNSDIAC
ncbi:hypothetical protein DPMN_075026 [Dreissena polymorpha]|uniref:Uncharacterized protein n=1 Tax=Dreissena polymorpha TaxID=45954 RepID=A0A9D3YJQ3_DREPO|nr:hypothetical protein DPMN_075026 [Dreissena polymorpha]